MNQHEPTPEQIKKQMDEALQELSRQNTPPSPSAEDDGVPTHELPENLPTPQEVIEEEGLGVK